MSKDEKVAIGVGECKGFLDDLEEIDDLCDNVKEGCEDFAESVRSNARSMAESIDNYHTVSPKQENAIKNWKAALEKVQAN